VFMSGQISASSEANGWITKWTDTGCLHGPISGNMKGSMRTIKNTVLVFSLGQMERSTVGFGIKENSMATDRFNSKKDSNETDNGFQGNILEVTLKHTLSRQTSRLKRCHKQLTNLKQVEKGFSIELQC